MLQVFRVVGEALVARTLINHVARETHVTEANLFALQVRLQHRFDPGVMLHSVGQAVPEDGDDVVWLELERDIGLGGRPGRGGQHRRHHPNGRRPAAAKNRGKKLNRLKSHSMSRRELMESGCATRRSISAGSQRGHQLMIRLVSCLHRIFHDSTSAQGVDGGEKAPCTVRLFTSRPERVAPK